MTVNRNNQQYEELYTELLGRGEMLHESNKRRIRRGLVILVILPVILEFIRWITDSDKVVFLIIWIIIMFVLSAYLISIEYLDYSIEETLRDVTDTEADFDGLLPKPELRRVDLHERIKARFAELRQEEEDDEDDGEPEEAPARASDAAPSYVAAERPARKPAERPARVSDDTMVIDDALEQLDEVREAEAAMEELNETVPAEIIAAMKEAFDADMQKREKKAAESGASAAGPVQSGADAAGSWQGGADAAGEEVPE